MPNRYRYLLSRLYNVLSGVILGLMFIFAKRRKTIILNSNHNNSFNHNSKYLFSYLYQNSIIKSEYDIYYVLNDEQKRNELNDIFPGKHFISNKGFGNKVLILKASFWFCSTLETPIGGIFLSFRRKVIHLGHGMPYKNVGFLERDCSLIKRIYYTFNNSNFSKFLSVSDFFDPVIEGAFNIESHKVLRLPQPRADAVLRLPYINNTLTIKEKEVLGGIESNASLNILYAPTWRHFSDVRLFPFAESLEDVNDFLVENNIIVWLRPHPFFDFDISSILSFSNIKKMGSEELEDINLALSAFDGLLTDYSSLFFDFMLLQRKVGFLDYDIKEYIEQIGLVNQFEKVKVGDSLESFHEFKEFCSNIKEPGYDLTKVELTNYLEYKGHGSASEYVISQIINN